MEFNIPALGFLQFDVKLGDPEANMSQLEKGLEQLAPQGPGLIVLPELWSCGFAYARLTEYGLATPNYLMRLQALAQKYNIYLAGSLPEEVLTEIDTTLYNTMYVVGPKGIAGSFRKQQLFAPMVEDQYFQPGDNPQPITTELGRLAALVCYDLRFPEISRAQVMQGAGVIVVSAQWPAARRAHWQTLLTARAIENQAYVVGCNRCGITGETEFGGSSMVIGPDGTVLAQAEDHAQGAFVRLEANQLALVRGRFNTVGPKPYAFNDQDKLADLPELSEIVQHYKSIGSKVVFTNGCFDILHEGHVTYLEAARKEGDCLIVGLNSDSSVRSLGKGDDRPMNHEQSRARVLAALGCVDHVVLFSEETPHTLITTLMPDVLVKGGDWPVEKIVGHKEVLNAGGRVLSIPLVENYSTTSLIEKIRKS